MGTIEHARSNIQEYLGSIEEKIDLLRLIRIFVKLQSVQPGAVLNAYFATRRAMGYRGRKVIHISRTCPDLWQVRVVHVQPPPARL